jgi:hypothetical protein
VEHALLLQYNELKEVVIELQKKLQTVSACFVSGKRQKEYCIPSESRTHALRLLGHHLYLQGDGDQMQNYNSFAGCTGAAPFT